MKQAACLQGPAARRSAAVKARRSRLAEHGALRRAHGLDGETGVLGSPCQASPTPTPLFLPHLLPDWAQDRDTPLRPQKQKKAARPRAGCLSCP